MIKNVIFDIGNVLTDFRWKDFLRAKGFEGEELERIAKASVESTVWPELDRGVWSFEQVMEGFVKNAPDPEKRSRTVAPGTWNWMLPKMASFTRSSVGRVSLP